MKRILKLFWLVLFIFGLIYLAMISHYNDVIRINLKKVNELTRLEVEPVKFDHAESLRKKYLERVFEFLKSGHPKVKNTDEERLITGLNNKTNFISNANLSSIIQVLPIYHSRTYKKLIKVSWFNYDDHDSGISLPEELKLYNRAYASFEHERLMELFAAMFYFFSRNNVEFMLSDGSLIGSLRHFDQIPWDDDSDVIIHQKDKDKVLELFEKQKVFRDFSYTRLQYTIKIFHKSTKSAGDNIWNFPFIDIFPSEENATHFTRQFYDSFYNASKSTVYPLVLRPFGKYWLPASKNGEAFEREIGTEDIFGNCYSGYWNHRNENSQNTKSGTCKQLEKYYRFTKRLCKKLSDSETCMETLDYGKKMIYLFYFDDRPVVVTMDKSA